MRIPFFYLCGVLLPLTQAVAVAYTHSERNFGFEFDEKKWGVVPEKSSSKQSGQDVDRTMAQKTLVTLQRQTADDKYHARFSVVADNLDKFKGTPTEQLIAYRKHALDFMKSQRFYIQSTSEVKLPGLQTTAFEIVANQRDFGLTFRQVIFLRENEAYLLTAAARTAKFDEYQKEMQVFFSTFRVLP